MGSTVKVVKCLWEAVFVEVPSVHEQEAGATPKIVAGPVLVFGTDRLNAVTNATLNAAPMLTGIDPGKLETYVRPFDGIGAPIN